MLKMTIKDIESLYNTILSCPYGQGQYIFRAGRRIGYNSGINGTNFLIFELDNNACVLSGNKTPRKFPRIPQQIVDEYDKKAYDALLNTTNSKQYNNAMDSILTLFISELQKL